MPAELRRQQNTLVVISTGVIAFAMWSVLKTFLYCFFHQSELLNITPEMEEGAILISQIILYILVFLALALDLIPRIYVARSAIAVGRGRKKGKAYIVVSALMAAESVASILAEFFFMDSATFSNSLDTFASVLVDLTSLLMWIELIIAAMKVRKMTK